MRPVNTFDSVDGTANDCQKFKVKYTSNDFGNKVEIALRAWAINPSGTQSISYITDLKLD